MGIGIVSNLSDYIESLGLIGIFIVSFLSNVLPYLTVPYLVMISLYSASINSLSAKIAASLAGGIGAGLGKTLLFFLARSGRRLISSEKQDEFKRLVKVFDRGIFMALLLFAATPLPDDIFYIPISITGYSIVKFFIAVSIGKTVITSLSVAFGSSISAIAGESGVFNPRIILAVIIATLVVTYVILKINWNRVIEVYTRKGIIWAFIEIMMQTLMIVFFLKPLYRKYTEYIDRVGE